MTLVSPDVPNPGDEITAASIATPVEKLADVINGNLDDTNIAGLSGSKIADDSLNGTKLTDGTVPFAKLDNVWWEELGRTTLGATGDTLSVSGIAARQYLRVLLFVKGSGSVTTTLTFNGDTGTNYARRINVNGGSDTTNASQSNIGLTSGDSNNTYLMQFDITNVTSSEKFVSGHVVLSPAGAANIPPRLEVAAKWANTANQITTVSLNQTSTGDFAAGSEIVVLGHD